MANLTGELFIGGLWLQGHGAAFESVQPVTGEAVWEGTGASLADEDAAVRSARDAFLKWRRKSFAERLAVFEAFAELLDANKGDLAHQIGLETGKRLWESHTEVDAMAGKIGISVKAYNDRTGHSESDVAGGHAVLRHKPHGWLLYLACTTSPATSLMAILYLHCWR